MADEEEPVTIPLVDSVKEQVDKLHSTVEGLDAFVSRVFESHQAYYEKLTLLNGATLTLLFSAMGLLAKGSSPVIKAQIASPVFAGCWMLVVSIIICILHNYINLYYLFHGNASVIAFSINSRRHRARIALIRAGASLDDGDWADSGKSAIHSKGTSLTERLCWILGILAQALTISAYVEFLRALHRIFLTV